MAFDVAFHTLEIDYLRHKYVLMVNAISSISQALAPPGNEMKVSLTYSKVAISSTVHFTLSLLEAKQVGMLRLVTHGANMDAALSDDPTGQSYWSYAEQSVKLPLHAIFRFL